MKQTNNPNINTKTYWNGIYGNEEKREQYAAQGTDLKLVRNNYIKPTARFQKALDNVKDGDRVLDIGCGVGVFTNLVKNTYPNNEVWGVDISNKAIEDNTKENPQITYKHHYIGKEPSFPTEYFDFVFSGEVLEHLDHPKDLFIDAYKALKPGGIFLLSTPNGDSIKSEEHVWEFTHDDVEDLYFSNGFTDVDFIYLPDLEHMLVIMAYGTKV